MTTYFHLPFGTLPSSILSVSTRMAFFTAAIFILFSNPVLAQTDELNRLEKSGVVVLADKGAVAVLVQGSVLYAATERDGLYSFSLAKDRFNPEPLSAGGVKELSIPTGGIAVAGNFLYVTDNLKGVVVFNVAKPDDPKLVTSFKTADEAWDVQTDATGNFLYVAAGKAGVETWDISNPSSPQRVGQTNKLTWDFAWGLTLQKNTLYVSDRKNGVKIMDATRPTVLTLKASYDTRGELRNTFITDSLLFLADGLVGFEVININNLSRIRRAYSQAYTQGYAGAVIPYPLNPNFIYVSGGRAGLFIYDGRKFYDEEPAPDKTDKFVPERGFLEYRNLSAYGHAIYVATNKGVHVYQYDLSPLLTNISNKTSDENQPFKYVFEGFDPDSDKTSITLAGITAQTQGSAYNKATRELTWTPTFEQSGKYDFTARISEQTEFGLGTEQKFRLTVPHVNRKPTQPQPLDQLVKENDSLRYTIPEGTDPDKEDAGKLTYIADSLPRGAAFDADSRTLRWLPDYTQAGDFRVRFTVRDANTDGKGILTDSKGIGVRIDNVNLGPKFDSLETQVFAENKAQTFEILARDPDKEDDGKLTYTATSLPPGATFDAAARKVSWTPTFEQAGDFKASFTVRDQGLDLKLKPAAAFVKEDKLTVNLTVKQTNRSPKFTAIGAKQATETKLITFTIAATDPDKEDLNKLTFTTGTLPEGATFDAGKRTFTWTPTFEQSGTPTAVFKVTDTGIDGTALSDSEAVVITVSNVNRKPTMEKIADAGAIEDSAMTFTVNATDPDKEDDGKLKITVAGAPNGSAFDGKVFTWKPSFEQSGSYKLTFKVTDDGALTDETSMTIKVDNKNRPPVLTKMEGKSVEEKADLLQVVNAADPDKEDAGKLVFTAEGLPQGAKFDARSRTFTWKPEYGQKGEYKVLFKVKDSFGAEVSEEVSYKVGKLNRKPAMVKIKDASLVARNSADSASVGTSLTTKFSATDLDTDDKLVFSATGLPSGATLDEQGNFSFAPTEKEVGKFTVEVSVKDGVGGEDKTAFRITVAAPKKTAKPSAPKPKKKTK